MIGSVGGNWRIAAHVRQPTAWGDDALLAALDARLAPRLRNERGGTVAELLRGAARLESDSAIDPPRLGILAVPGAGGSHAEARAAAERVGWLVSAVGNERPTSLAHRFAAIRETGADAWLVLGPRRSGGPAAVDTARLLVAAAGGVDGLRISWIAAQPPGEEVERALLGAELGYVEYNAPVRRLGSAASPFRGDAWRGHGTLQGALEALLVEVCAAAARPRPALAALRRATVALSRKTGLRLLAVDLGARQASATLADVDGWSGHTSFEAGVSAPADTTLRHVGEIAASLPFEADDARVADAVRTLTAHPSTVADTPDDLAIARAAARERLGDLLAADRPIRGVDVVIGCGGMLATPASGSDAAELLVEGVRPLGVTQLAIDAAGVLPGIGALDGESLAEAVDALAGDLVVPLGAAVISSGGSPGETVMRVRVVRDGADPETLVLRYGQLEVVALPVGQSAELDIELQRGISLGAPRPLRRVRTRVDGGAAGLILDTRGIPIVVPRRADDRRAVLDEWHERLAREPMRHTEVA